MLNMTNVFSEQFYKDAKAGKKLDPSLVAGAMSAFASKPLKSFRKIKAEIAELATPGQFPDQVTNAFERIKIQDTGIDMAWLRAFSEVNLNNTNAPNYDIYDVESGIAFSKVPLGEDAKLYGVSGAKDTLYFDQYSAGLQIPKVWYDDQQFWNIDERVQDFTKKWYTTLSDTFYALIEALTDSTTYNVDYPSDTVSVANDVAAINDAVEDLLSALKDTGIAVSAQTELLLYCPISRAGRVMRALKEVKSINYSGEELVNPNLTVIPTLEISKSKAWTDSTGTTSDVKPLGYLVVPGNKNKYVRRQDLEIYPSQFNPKSNSTDTYAWSRIGGCVNEAQVRRLLPEQGTA